MAAEARAKAMKRLTAVYERDISGVWTVRVPRIRGCHTYGRTLQQARARLMEALRLFDVDPTQVVVVDQVRLPARILASVRRARRVRDDAETRRRIAQAELRAAASALARAGLSRRDAGALLGLSRQRIQQLGAG
jgi:hypothetical protein